MKEFWEISKLKKEQCGERMTRKILAWSDDLMVVRIKFESGATGALHTHPHSQVTYCISGKFKYIIEDREYILFSGDSVSVTDEKIHGITCIEEGEVLDIFSPCRKDFLE